MLPQHRNLPSQCTLSRVCLQVKASGNYAVIAPNMGKQIVAFQVRQPGPAAVWLCHLVCRVCFEFCGGSRLPLLHGYTVTAAVAYI